MNILLAPDFYLPMRSGVGIFVQNLASAFVRKGHRAVIVTPQLERAHPSFEMIDGIEVRRMPFVFPLRLLWQRLEEGLLQFCLHCPIDLQQLLRLMSDMRVEVMNVHGLNGPQLPYLLFAQNLSDCRFVVTLHGREFFRLGARHNRMRRFFLRAAFRRADRIIAISSHLASQVGRFCPEVSHKVVTIPNGVWVNEFGGANGCPFPSRYVLSVARLNPLKGHDVLLSAFRKVVRREEDVHLIIAGDGPQRVRLYAIILALGLKDRVTLLGQVGRERVKELLAGCEFLVLSSWSEGVPTVALEAMASGKAVIGTDVDGVPEIVLESRTGLLVPPGEPDALAEAMLALLKDRDDCKNMGVNGRALVEANYDFPQIADRYLTVYEKVLHEGRQS